MYRKDLFAQAGITMPERPTWDQIAEYAAKLKDPSQDRAGICLRAKPGWGEMFAPLTTVINTFGGQWYNMDWQAQVNSPAYTDAVKFYIDTLAASGEGDPVSFGFTECLNLFSQGRRPCGTTPPPPPVRWRIRRTRRSPARSAMSGHR